MAPAPIVDLFYCGIHFAPVLFIESASVTAAH